MGLAIFINDIDEAAYQATANPAINLNDNEKTQYGNEWRTHRERVDRLEKQRVQAFPMVIVQCTQILVDKMKHDPDLYTASTSYDLLKFMALIENTIFSQTKYQYPFATIYEQEFSFYSLYQ